MSSEVHRIPTLRIRHRFLDPESNRIVSDCRIFQGSYRIRYRISRPGVLYETSKKGSVGLKKIANESKRPKNKFSILPNLFLKNLFFSLRNLKRFRIKNSKPLELRIEPSDGLVINSTKIWFCTEPLMV